MDTSEIRNERKRLLRSCNECRRSKVRCIPSPDDDDKCKRCFQTNRDCVFSEVHSRAKRSFGGSTRISKIEERIDNIYSLLREGTSPADLGIHNEVTIAMRPPPALPTPTIPVAPIPQRVNGIDSQLAFPQATQEPSLPALASQDAAPRPDTLFDGLIRTDQADRLLQVFRVETQQYPLIVLPPWPIEMFYRERPILLLALLATCARLHLPDNHAVLELELRKTLASKLIVEGFRNLDILQGLMIFVSWFHFHAYAISQALTLLQIALSISLEVNEEGPGTPETRRTLLGAYLLSSTTSLTLRKFEWMNSNSSIISACELLGAESNSPLDAALIHAVKIQQLRDKIAVALGYGAKSRPVFGADRLEITVDTLQAQLQVLRNTVPPLGSSCWIPFMLHSTEIYITEISLHVGDGPSSTASPASASASTPSNNNAGLTLEAQQLVSVRNRLLVDCLAAAKRYLDGFLALPPAATRMDMLVDKSQVAHALVILIKLSLCPHAGDAFPRLRQACRVPHYLDAMIARSYAMSDSVRGGSSSGAGGGAGVTAATAGVVAVEDPYRLFGRTMERLRGWYERREVLAPGAGPGAELVSMSPMQVVNSSAEEDAQRQMFDFDLDKLDFMFLNGSDTFWS